MMIAIMITMLLLNLETGAGDAYGRPAVISNQPVFSAEDLGWRRVRKINSRITANCNEGIGGAKTAKPWYAKPRVQEFRRKPEPYFARQCRLQLFSFVVSAVSVNAGEHRHRVSLVVWRPAGFIGADQLWNFSRVFVLYCAVF